MKSSSVFWGVFLITIGLIYFGESINLFQTDLSGLVKLWPLIIVFIGISYFKIPNIYKLILSGLNGILFGLILVGMLSCRCSHGCPANWFSHSNVTINTEHKNLVTKSIALDSLVTSANLNITAGASSIDLEGITDSLMMYTAESEIINVQYDKQSEKSIANLNLKLGESNDINVSRHTEIALNNNINWKLNVNAGAGDLSLDLSKHKVNEVSIQSGVSSCFLKLGNRADTVNIDVNTGVSSVDIEIPKDMACKIQLKEGLSDINLDEFNKVNNNIYLTDNFDKTKKVIFINYEGALSSLSVNRY